MPGNSRPTEPGCSCADVLAATTGEAWLQLGAGILSGTLLNTLAAYMGLAQVTAVEGQDDEGHARQQVTLMAKDPGASGTFFRLARA